MIVAVGRRCITLLLIEVRRALIAMLAPNSQSVSHYPTPSRELMDHTHSTVLLFEYGDYLCNVIFSLCFSCLPPGLALEDVLLFPSLFTFLASCR